MNEARQRRGDADTAGHVVRQSRAPGACRDKLDGEGNQDEGQDNREDTEQACRRVVNGIPGLAGNLEPLTQRDDDGCGDRNEGGGVTLDLRISRPPHADGTNGRATDRREEARQEARLRRLGLGRASGARGRSLRARARGSLT